MCLMVLAINCVSAADVDDDPDQLGSMHHLLGVTPQQLRTLYMPNRKAAQVRRDAACRTQARAT